MAQERPLYTLYKNLKAQNYDVPDDYDRFENALTLQGEAGASNRHKIYDNLKSQNFDVPDTYERFYSALFTPVSRTSSRAKGGSVPLSEADKRMFINNSKAIVNDAVSRLKDSKRYRELKQQQAKRKNDFGRVDLGTNKNIFGDSNDNVVQDGIGGDFLTSDGGRTTSKVEAQARQGVLDKQANLYTEAVDKGDIPSVFDVRDKNGNYDLQENIGKDGTYLTEEGARNQLDRKLDYAYKRKKELEQALYDNMDRYGGFALLGDKDGNERLGERLKLTSALDQVKDEIGSLEALKSDSWYGDMGQALSNTVFRANSWDFGLSDFNLMAQMERIKTKMDNGIPLSGSEKALLQSKSGADAAAALADEKKGWLYRWTKIAGQSLPFMLDFYLTGGYGGITKAASKGALKFAAKRGMGKISAAILKNTGVVAADIVGSYAMAGTEQALKTGADIMQRHMGQLYQDEDGNYKFGTFDENGNLLHEGGESIGKALYKGFTAAMLENYTEKIFGHNYGIKKGLVSGLEKIGMTRTANFFKTVGKNAWYAGAKKNMKKFGIDGFFEEVMEEEINIPLNALLVGDNKMSDLLDKKQQLDIIGGMALSVGSMYAVNAPVKGAYNRAQYYRFKNIVGKADATARNAFGTEEDGTSKWDAVREQIDNTPNEKMGAVLHSILESKDTMSKEQIDSAIQYGIDLMKMRGYNLAKTEELTAKRTTGEQDTPEEKRQEEIENAYSEGQEADDSVKHDYQLEQNDKANVLAAKLGITPEQLHDMSDEQLDSMTGQSDELDQAIYEYQDSTARYQGVLDAANDKVDLAAHQAAQQVDQMTDISRGTVRNATIKGTNGASDYGVYIISGNLATHDDGTIDVGNSDKMIVYFDPTTGRKETAEPLMFSSVGEENVAEEVKEMAVTQAKEQAIKEIAGIIDGTVGVGSTFSTTDEQGNETQYEILADNGDGSAMITIDGNVDPNPHSFEELQQLKDTEDLKRLEVAKQQRAEMEAQRDGVSQTEQTEQEIPTETEAPSALQNIDLDKVVNTNGNIVRAEVTDNRGEDMYPDAVDVFLIDDKGAFARLVVADEDGNLTTVVAKKKNVKVKDTIPLEEYRSQMIPETTAVEGESGKTGENGSGIVSKVVSDKDFDADGIDFDNNYVVIHQTLSDNANSILRDGLHTIAGLNGTSLFANRETIEQIIQEQREGRGHKGSTGLVIMQFPKSMFEEGKRVSLDDISIALEEKYGPDALTTVPPEYISNFVLTHEGSENVSNEEKETPKFEDGTDIPVDKDGEVDFSQTDAAHAAEWYDTNLGDDAEETLSEYVKQAKTALTRAKEKKVKGNKPSELVASKKEKEAAIADAQAKYDSAVSIRDAYNERRIAKQLDSHDGRMGLLQKAKNKFSRLKNSDEWKNDTQALWNDTIGSILHRMYDGLSVNVFDHTPQTLEEYVSSSIAPYSLNYEGTDESKGVKQETGLERKDFAKSHVLAAEGKGTTVDKFVHKLWDNRPSQFESATDQDIRNALISLITSDMNAYDMQHVVENNRIAQAEKEIEDEKISAENISKENAPIGTTSGEQVETPVAEDAQTEIPSDVEVPEDATSEKPLGEQVDDVPFSQKEGAVTESKEERAKNIEDNRVENMKTVDNIIGKKTRKAFERIAKMMGSNIQFQYSDKIANGWYDPEKNTIYLSLSSAMTDGAQFIFGHEMTHEIKNLNPSAYEELRNLVKDSYTDDAYASLVDDMRNRYVETARSVGREDLADKFLNETGDYFEEEFVADEIGKMIDDTNYAHTLASRMSHPLLSALHDILLKIKRALLGTKYEDDATMMLRGIEQAYVKTMNRDAADIATATGEQGASYSLRKKPAPKNTIKVYKLMRLGLEDNTLNPLFIDSKSPTKLNVWYDADSPNLEQLRSLPSGVHIVNNETGETMSFEDWYNAHTDLYTKDNGKVTKIGKFPSKEALQWATDNNSRFIYIEDTKNGQKRFDGENRKYWNLGVNGSGSVSTFSMRPGWHAGSLPTMRQIGKGKEKNLRDDNFVWVEGEISADVDYNDEAQKNPDKDIPNRIPEDGYYLKATNANKASSQADRVGWYVAGSFKANRIMSDAECRKVIDDWNAAHPDLPVEYDYEREGGKMFNADTMRLEDKDGNSSPRFSLRVYHGSGADFSEFDFNHMSEGAGSQAFGWGGYVTSSKKIGKDYATMMDRDPSKGYYRIQKSSAERFAKKYPTLESFLEGVDKIATNKHFTEQEKIDYYNERMKDAEPYHNMYEVNIPDDNGSNYLEWYGEVPSTLNKEKLVDMVMEKSGAKDKAKKNLVSSDYADGVKRDILNIVENSETVQRLYVDLSSFAKEKDITNILSSLGYTGIKYPAGTIMGGNEEGDTNYVIFKPEDMKIVDHTKFSIRTYHGSQASFDHFDHSFMGSGEGAQAYGWGTYVSEVEGIAKAYAKQNAKKHNSSKLTYKGEPLTLHTPSVIYRVAVDMDKYDISAKEAISNTIDAYEKKLSNVADTPFGKIIVNRIQGELNILKDLNPSDFNIEKDYDTIAQNLANTKSGLSLLEDELKDANSYVDLYSTRLEEAQKELAKAKEIGTGLGVDMYESDVAYYSEQVKKYKDKVKTKEGDIEDVKAKVDKLQKKLDSMEKPRNLYTVEIPDDTGDNYIGWDESLTDKQKDMWKKAAVSLAPKGEEEMYEKETEKLLGRYKNQPLTGEKAYKYLTANNTPKKVSLALNDAGFDGVKVIAQRNTGGNKDGKMNYVIFDENNAKIASHEKFSLKDEKAKIIADAKKNGTYLKAPNGKDSRLSEEKWATVRTDNFKKWFGDWERDPENASKVVDDNGEPLVVYHGRSTDFNTFEHKEGVRFIMGLEDKVKSEGFFFSPNKEFAAEYASNASRHRGGKANIVPCFLDIRKPMDLTAENYDETYEDVTGWEYQVGMDSQSTLWDMMDEEGMADKMKAKGYDGAIFVEEVDDNYEPTQISYCALDPNQIKSADNNNGDFSSDNNDIRYSLDKDFHSRLKSAIGETDINPSDAQKESGNYKKGHIKFGGYDFTIENPKGSERKGVDSDGKQWSIKMHDTYGYVRGKIGKDGDHLDMFINDSADLDKWNGSVYVVDQVNQDGSFDEHKVMYGYNSEDEAKEAYLANYSKGWKGLGNITGVDKETFDKWLDSSKRKTKPFDEYNDIANQKRLSLKSGGLKPLLTVDGKPVVLKEDNGKVDMNYRTWQEEKEQVRATLINDAELDEDEADALIAQADVVADTMKGFMQRYPRFRDFQYSEAGNRPIIRDNGDYLSFDYSFNCIKKDAINSVMDKLVSLGKGGHLGVTQVEAIKKILQKHGFLTPCVMCYVEGKRKVLKQSKMDEAKWNAVRKAAGLEDMLMGEPTKLSDEQRNILQELADGKGLERVENYTTKNGEGIMGDSIKKIATLMLNSDMLRGNMNYEWMMSPSSFTEMYNKFGNTGLMEYLSIGQYRGKQLLEAVPFSLNSIPRDIYLKMFSNVELKDRGGLRQFSYEDARAMMFFDYYTQFLLMQGARSPEHLYTKRPFMPEMFGKTGAMINQSLIVDVWKGDKWHQDSLGLNDTDYQQWLRENAGFIPRGALDENDKNYVENSTELVPAWSVESFPIDIAMENAHNKEYKGTVGNVVVAPSVNFIKWALDNPDIHMVLAYHAAGSSPIMKSLSGYDMATVMDDGYHTLGTDGKAIKYLNVNDIGLEINGGALQWNRLLRHNGYDAKKAAQTYLDYCHKNGLTPMFNYDGVVDNPNYYKMLTDFRMYDEDGKNIKQKGVKAVLPENWQDILNKYLEQEQGNYNQTSSVTLSDDIMKEINAVTKYTSIEADERNSVLKLLGDIYGKDNVDVLSGINFDKSLDDATEKGRAQMLRDGGGMVYGFTAGGKIVLNENVFNANTPLHEHAHIYMKVLQAFNPRLYERGKELWDGSPLWNECKADLERIGDDASDDRVFSECMARFTGAENERIIANVTGITDKNWIQKALTWMKEMWDGVRSAFTRWTKGDLDSLTNKQFARMPLRAFYDEKERKAYAKKVKALSEAGGMEYDAHFSLKSDELKKAQLAIINETNPMLDDYHTGIRKVEDIRSFDEAYQIAKADMERYEDEQMSSYPDLTDDIVEDAIHSGKITVYSSKPIKNGNFVTPSRMQAEDYAGGGKVYEKTIPTKDVAWIDIEEGQYAKVKKGDVSFSLRGSTSYDEQLSEWKKRNHLPEQSEPLAKPVRGEGESVAEFANRMVHYVKNQNLWKTAPKPTGYTEALEKWKKDNGLDGMYPPIHPNHNDFESADEYNMAVKRYRSEKEVWKDAPKPKDFDLSVDVEDMSKQMRNIRRSMLNQKDYDKRTVKAISDLVNTMLNIGWGDGLSRGKVERLLSAAKNATGANDVKKHIDNVMGILADNYLSRISKAYDNLINTNGVKADQSGVIKIGSLDVNGQNFLSEYKRAINMDEDSINERIANLEDDSAKNPGNATANGYRLSGIEAAVMFRKQIVGNDADIADVMGQIKELTDKKNPSKSDKELRDALKGWILENKLYRVQMYSSLLGNVQAMISDSKTMAKEFKRKIDERKNDILHRANLDMEGEDSTYYDTDSFAKRARNNSLLRAVMSPTYTFEQFLKFFGKHHANGEGYLYNYFIGEWHDAVDENQVYDEMNRENLDKKAKELFGKKFLDLVGIDGDGMKEMDCEVTDPSNKETGKRTIHLKQGQMLYIYLVNKETDGQMKLRSMGITEADVAAIEGNLDPKIKAIGEWLQDEYLPECQRRYQGTHTKYFGAPMKEVDNYFPLVINNRARNIREDVNQDTDAMSQLAGTSTGAIVTRRVNTTPLDIENADAIAVAYEHLKEMEEWSAMLPFRQDINTLLSYTHFRNQVTNQKSIAYGSGNTLWNEFKQTAQIAAGTYKPKIGSLTMDSRISKALGLVSMAKISGRLWTALKQSQSALSFITESDPQHFVWYGVNPYGSWKWAYKNLPLFRKRVERMAVGDTRIKQFMDSVEKTHSIVKTIADIGMFPNILVDSVTCAVGARSVYKTELNKLLKRGYPKEKAEEKAMLKASLSYNTTQQSSEGAFVSPLQVDRTYVSAALSLFKNANYAYGRKKIEAVRGLAKTWKYWGEHKNAMVESMKRQIMEEDGLEAGVADKIANTAYKRTFYHNLGMLLNYMTIMPISWALYKVLPYIVLGDDDDKKLKMAKDSVLQGLSTTMTDDYAIPFVSSAINAGLEVGDDGKPTFNIDKLKYQNLYINPATSDLANIYSIIGNQKWWAAANKFGMLGMQALVGFNPETVGQWIEAFSEYDGNNGNTSIEVKLALLKAINAPESSIRGLYIDELGLDDEDTNKVSLAELEKRYAERQLNKDFGISKHIMSKEAYDAYVEKYKQSFEKKIQEKMDKIDSYDKKKADEIFNTTSDSDLKKMIDKKRTKEANGSDEKNGDSESEKKDKKIQEVYDNFKNSFDLAADISISVKNKAIKKKYKGKIDKYNGLDDTDKELYKQDNPDFESFKEYESKYKSFSKEIKALKEGLIGADSKKAASVMNEIRQKRDEFMKEQENMN